MREITTYVNDTYRITYRLKQPDGQPVDITGAQVTITAKRDGVVVPITADSTITGPDGTIALRIVMPATAGRYVVTTRLTYSNGDRITIDRVCYVVLEV